MTSQKAISVTRGAAHFMRAIATACSVLMTGASLVAQTTSGGGYAGYADPCRCIYPTTECCQGLMLGYPQPILLPGVTTPGGTVLPEGKPEIQGPLPQPGGGPTTGPDAGSGGSSGGTTPPPPPPPGGSGSSGGGAGGGGGGDPLILGAAGCYLSSLPVPPPCPPPVPPPPVTGPETPGSTVYLFVDPEKFEPPAALGLTWTRAEIEIDDQNDSPLAATVTVPLAQIIQVAGPGRSLNAYFTYSQQHRALPGRPLVFSSDKSGAQLWLHNHLSPIKAPYLEIKHVDGSIAHFDLFQQGDPRWQTFQLTSVTDPYDNRVDLVYDQNAKLQRIDYPNGIRATWNWTPSWNGNWPGHACVEVTYAQVVGSTQTPMPNLTWGIVYHAPAGQAFSVRSGLRRLYLPAGRFFAGAMLDATGAVATGLPTYDFTFDQAPMPHMIAGSCGRTSKVGDVNPMPAGPFRQVFSMVYDAQSRVTEMRKTVAAIQNAARRFDYTRPPTRTAQGVTLATVWETDALGNERGLEWDPATGRSYRYTERAVDNYSGRPRAWDPDNQNLGSNARPEPRELITDSYYDQTCTCSKPVKMIESATGEADRVTHLTYDPVHKELTSVTVASPSNATGAPSTVTRSYTYQRAAGHEFSAWTLASETTPAGTWTYHPTWANRADPVLHGKMLASLTRRMTGLEIRVDANTTTSTTVESSIVFNLRGTPTYSGGSLQGQPRFVTDGDGVTTTLTYDRNGFLQSTATGDMVTTLSIDAWGRLASVTQNTLSSGHQVTIQVDQDPDLSNHRVTTTVGGVAMDRRTYYDAWGNLLAQLYNNKDSANGTPHRHGMTPTNVRPWVSDWFEWDGNLRIGVYRDRRPLDESATGVVENADGARFVHTRFLYRPDGTLQYVIRPNGSVTEYVVDGYRQVYRARIRTSDGSTQDLGRSFVNGFLEPVAFFQGTASDPRWRLVKRNPAGAIHEMIEPTVATLPPGYTGVGGGATHYYTLDTAGAIVGHSVFGGSTLLSDAKVTRDQLGRANRVTIRALRPGGVDTGTSEVTIYRYALARMTQLERVWLVGGRFVDHSYDASGRLQWSDAQSSQGGVRVSYAYDIGTPFLRTVRALLSDTGNVNLSRTFETEFRRDPLGRVIELRENGSGTSTQVHSFAWTSTGLVDRYTDPKGHVHTYLADALGRPVQHALLGSSAIVDEFAYGDVTTNAWSTVTAVDGRGRTTVRYFDFVNRPFMVRTAGANAADPPSVGSPHKPFWQFGTYDAFGQLREVHDGDSGTTRVWYDSAQRLIARELVNPGQAAISTFQNRDILNRDALGRVLSAVTYGGLAGSSLQVRADIDEDTLNRWHSQAFTWGLGGTNSLAVDTTYQGGERFRRTTLYDDRLGLANGTAALSLRSTPDAVHRISSMDWVRSPSTGVGSRLVDYGYFGGRTSLRRVTLDNGNYVDTTLVYDDQARLKQLRDLSGSQTLSAFDFDYDDAGHLRREHYARKGPTPGGFVAVGDRHVVDDFQRIVQSWLGVDAATMAMTEAQLADPNTVKQFVCRLTYGLDPSNNRSRTVKDDALSGSTTTTNYATQNQGQAQGPSNRYHSVGVSNWLHDQRGNTVFDGQKYSVYDYANRLTEVWDVCDGNAPLVVASTTLATLQAARAAVLARFGNDLYQIARQHTTSSAQRQLRQSIPTGLVLPAGVTARDPRLKLRALYGYDAFNRRAVRVVVGLPNTFHTWDGWREAMESTVDGTRNVVQKQFVWGSRLDELIALRARNANGTFRDLIPLQGHGDSIVGMLDATNGSRIEHVQYDPWGNPTFFDATGTQTSTSPSGTPYLWKGLRRDVDSGLTYLRNRYVDTVNGRFRSGDRVGDWGDPLNLGNGYAYGANDPRTFNDPDGRCIWFIVIAIVAFGAVEVAADRAETRASGGDPGPLLSWDTAQSFGEGALVGGISMATGTAAFRWVGTGTRFLSLTPRLGAAITLSGFTGGATAAVADDLLDGRAPSFESTMWGGGLGVAGGWGGYGLCRGANSLFMRFWGPTNTTGLGLRAEGLAQSAMSRNGFQFVAAVQNRSRQGIDLVFRDRAGRLVFCEVKGHWGYGAPRLSAAQSNPTSFVESRLSRAATMTRGFDDPQLAAQAQAMLDELANGADYVLINVDQAAGLFPDITMTPWR